MSNPSHIDKALKRVQDGERRASMRLRAHLGLSPLPSRPSASTSSLISASSAAMPVEAPPPIPARNPARGHHYTGNHNDVASCNFPLNEAANVAEKPTTSRDEEAEASCAVRKKDVDTNKSDAIMDDLSDAIGQALDEWKDASNHK